MPSFTSQPPRNGSLIVPYDISTIILDVCQNWSRQSEQEDLDRDLVYPVPAVLACSIDAKTSVVDQYVALTYFLTPKCTLQYLSFFLNEQKSNMKSAGSAATFTPAPVSRVESPLGEASELSAIPGISTVCIPFGDSRLYLYLIFDHVLLFWHITITQFVPINPLGISDQTASKLRAFWIVFLLFAIMVALRAANFF